MKGVSEFPQIFLFRPFVDMRKQIHGLTAIVQEAMGLNPLDASLYVFCNRRRDLLKCLYWDKTGFAMWVKRLDQERFCWPKKLHDEVVVVGANEMQWLLSGYDVWKMKPHKSLVFDKVF